MDFPICGPLDAGLLYEDVAAVWGEEFRACKVEPGPSPERAVAWRSAAAESRAPAVLGGAAEPFQPTGNLRVLEGDLGRAIMKTSGGRPERHFVAVVRLQVLRANGMPELHKLMRAPGPGSARPGGEALRPPAKVRGGRLL
jgi:phosphogluconate dehydratase